jgi:hypothetical protein
MNGGSEGKRGKYARTWIWSAKAEIASIKLNQKLTGRTGAGQVCTTKNLDEKRLMIRQFVLRIHITSLGIVRASYGRNATDDFHRLFRDEAEVPVGLYGELRITAAARE